MLKNIKVSKLLIYVFAIMMLSIVVVAAISLVKMGNMNKQSGSLYSEDLIPVSHIGRIQDAFVKNRLDIVTLVYERDATKYDTCVEQVSARTQQADALFTELKNKELPDEARQHVQAVSDFLVPYRDIRTKIFDKVQEGDFNEAQRMLEELGTSSNDVAKELTALSDSIENGAKSSIDNINAEFKGTFFVTLAIAILILLIALVCAIITIKSIDKPMREMVNVTKQIADGDLGATILFKSKNEFGTLASGLQTVIRTLQSLVSEAETLTSASSAGDFSKRANTDGLRGGYKAILDGVNNTLETVADKVFWYEAMTDSMPNPLLVLDNDHKYTYVNKATCVLLGQPREKIIGQTSKNIEGFEQFTKYNNSYSNLKLGATDLKMVMAYLYDRKGEYAGIVETGIDMTKDKERAAYQQVEVDRLAQNLNMLAQGQLAFDLAVAEANEHTREDRENFVRINDSLKAARENLSAYIGETADVLGAVAGGNLDVSTNGDFKGEFVQIKESMNRIIDSLNDTLAQINQASSQVLSGADQVASASQALSQGSTEQASSIEELSATIEDISSQIKKNAQNAQVAQGIAMESAKTIEELSKQMNTMMQSMDRISDSSQKISKIIKTIDEIAFQTNILALNAAVEAARAGEAGKGFAVVADEVRNLASKSAEAAKDTATLIENSISAVEEGTKVAGETAKTLTVIVDEATKSGQLIGEISSASAAQAMAITQTTQGVNQISSVVQTNSATAQETAAASEELSGQADMLNDLVGRFILRGQAVAKVPKGAPALNLSQHATAGTLGGKSKY